MPHNILPGVVANSRLGRLLDLGLFVVETRTRRRDGELEPWTVRAAFAKEADAIEYHATAAAIGHAYLHRPLIS